MCVEWGEGACLPDDVCVGGEWAQRTALKSPNLPAVLFGLASIGSRLNCPASRIVSRTAANLTPTAIAASGIND